MENLRCVVTCRLAGHGADSCGGDREVVPVLDKVGEEGLGHGTAAHVSGADEEDVLLGGHEDFPRSALVHIDGLQLCQSQTRSWQRAFR